MLSESLYGRTWHAARDAALGPALAATGLARRPYDLRHAALSLWLTAGASLADIAARAGNSVHVPQGVYLHCIDDQDDTTSRLIEDALGAGPDIADASRSVIASGSPNRRSCPRAVRHTSAHSPRSAAPRASRHHRTGRRTAEPSPHQWGFHQLNSHQAPGLAERSR